MQEEQPPKAIALKGIVTPSVSLTTPFEKPQVPLNREQRRRLVKELARRAKRKD